LRFAALPIVPRGESKKYILNGHEMVSTN
jgi:hypothetical protein